MRSHSLAILVLIAASVACLACRGEASKSRRVPFGAAYDEGPAPEIVATMTCFQMARRRFADGTESRGPTEALVVRRNGTGELHDVDEEGLLIAETKVETDRVARLAAFVTTPEWANLVYERGSPFPDGASCVIRANHRRVKRFDNPDDEPIIQATWVDLKAIWMQVERSPWRGSRPADAAADGSSDAAAKR